ncbi:hypothetical protein BT96DRAFT_81322 [Gymnopus androsaceus JB14]|uniref:Uncharacterized protein n=1 Tax=Gymnopus androsaceus JB14 TaxID=1447944 RepID=A0A6A4IAV1_9AGAR|nr:hypothetical protein BT96DRAFT_81322 [Gymnopus androsaceus JB14]
MPFDSLFLALSIHLIYSFYMLFRHCTCFLCSLPWHQWLPHRLSLLAPLQHYLSIHNALLYFTVKDTVSAFQPMNHVTRHFVIERPCQ